MDTLIPFSELYVFLNIFLVVIMASFCSLVVIRYILETVFTWLIFTFDLSQEHKNLVYNLIILGCLFLFANLACLADLSNHRHFLICYCYNYTLENPRDLPWNHIAYHTIELINTKFKAMYEGVLYNRSAYLPINFVLDNLNNPSYELKSFFQSKYCFLVPADVKANNIYICKLNEEAVPFAKYSQFMETDKMFFYQIVEEIPNPDRRNLLYRPVTPFFDGTMSLPKDFAPTQEYRRYISPALYFDEPNSNYYFNKEKASFEKRLPFVDKCKESFLKLPLFKKKRPRVSEPIPKRFKKLQQKKLNRSKRKKK